MGLLDDAIREHLELKRRHGADASEVARLERDAFGPVRGGAPHEDDVAPAPADEEPEFDDVPAPLAEEHPPAAAPEPVADEWEYAVDDTPAERPRAAAPPVEPAPPAEPQATAAFSLEDLQAAEASAEHPPGHAPDPDAPVRHGYDDDESVPVAPEPNEPELEPEPEVIPADDEPVEHDELEETPDFLQETPEHDRLWFEQKPPRDFDF